MDYGFCSNCVGTKASKDILHKAIEWNWLSQTEAHFQHLSDPCLYIGLESK